MGKQGARANEQVSAKKQWNISLHVNTLLGLGLLFIMRNKPCHNEEALSQARHRHTWQKYEGHWVYFGPQRCPHPVNVSYMVAVTLQV